MKLEKSYLIDACKGELTWRVEALKTFGLTLDGNGDLAKVWLLGRLRLRAIFHS